MSSSLTVLFLSFYRRLGDNLLEMIDGNALNEQRNLTKL